MHPEVQARYTSEVRAAVAHAVGVAPDALQDIDAFESLVHEIAVDDSTRIVKATWSGRRSAEAVQAELDFVTYLADHGAPACRPLALRSGALLDTIPCEGGGWHVTVWEKAPGGHLLRAELQPEHFGPWGALVGRFHRLASVYRAEHGPDARPTWREELDGLAVGAHNEPDLIEHYQVLRERIAALPQDPKCFGPIHADLHHGNIHWDDDGAMHVFDFEDMIDYWFVYDLAVVLFHSVRFPDDESQEQARCDAFAPALLDGYRSEYELAPEQYEALPLFLSEREQVIRAVILRSIPPEKRSDIVARFVEEAGVRIRAGQPPLGVDWRLP